MPRLARPSWVSKKSRQAGGRAQKGQPGEFMSCCKVAAVSAGLLVMERWRAAIVMYSAAVSVKMNVLLMAPSVLIVLLKVRLASHSPSRRLNTSPGGAL